MGTRTNSRTLRFHDMYVFLDKDGKPVDKGTSVLLLDKRPGSTTTIRLARRIKRSNGEDIPYDQQPLVAVKWTKEGVSTGKILPSVLQLEAEIMREIGNHEHILKLEDFLIEEVESNIEPGRMVKQYWFVIQYAAGQDLLQWIRNAMMQWEVGKKESEVPTNVCVHLSLPVIRSIARQALLALAHMHSKHVWHRDCKPDNLFIRDDFPADLVDMVPFVVPAPPPSSSLSPSSSLKHTTAGAASTTTADFFSTQDFKPNDDGNWDKLGSNGEGLLSFSDYTDNNNNSSTPDESTTLFDTEDTRIDSGSGGGLMISGTHVSNSVRYELWVRPSFARRRAGVNDSVIFTDSKQQTSPPVVKLSPTPENNTKLLSSNSSVSSSTTPTSASSVPTSVPQTIVNSASKDPVPYILLSDFDAAKIWNRDDTGVDRQSSLPADSNFSKEVGNKFFRAPEADTSHYDSAVDIWSLGMTLLYGYCAGLELVRSTSERTLVGPDTQFITDPIAGGDEIRKHGLTDTIYDRINEMVIARGRSQGIDPLLGSLLRRMIVKNPADRINAVDALNHEFFRSYTHLQKLRIPQVLHPYGSNTTPKDSPNIYTNNTNLRSSFAPEVMSRSSSAGVSNSSTVTSDGTVQTSLFEDTYRILLKPNEVLTTRKDAFCLVKDVVRLPTAIPHPYLKNGDKAIIKWYDLLLMGETAHLDADEVNERRLDRAGKPLKHEYLATIYDVYSQYYPSLPPGKEPGDPDTDKCHPSLILVVEPAKGRSLDQFLLGQGEKAVNEWSHPDRDYWMDRANSRRLGALSPGPGGNSMNRSITNVSNASSPRLMVPELAHVVCGPYLAATIVKQLLLAVQYLHSEGQAHRDIRMYAILLKDADITVQGTQCYPNNPSKENLLVQVTLELDLETTTVTNDKGSRVSRRPLPYLKLSPVNPIRAGDSYDYTDFVLHKLPHQRTPTALDLWAIGDLLNLLLKGIQIKPRLASPLDMERRSHEISVDSIDREGQETIDSLRNYDPSIHGRNTVEYIERLLHSSWFQKYGNVIDPRDYTPPVNPTTTLLPSAPVPSSNPLLSSSTIPTELPPRTGTVPAKPLTVETVPTTVSSPSVPPPPPPPSASRIESWIIIALLMIIIAYLLNDRASKK